MKYYQCVRITLRAAVLLLCLSSTVSFAQQTARSFNLAGDKIKGYLEYLPSGYANSNKKYPILIFFHGSGERGLGTPSDLNKVKKHGPPKKIEEGHPMEFMVNGVKEQLIVISPQLNDGSWYPPTVDVFVDYIIDRYKVDRDRVYLTGLSLGAEICWSYPSWKQDQSYASQIAAIAPIANTLNFNTDRYDVCNIARKNVKVWSIHGGDDNVSDGLNDTRKWVNGANACSSSKVKFTIYPGLGHTTSWQRAYRTDNSAEDPNVYEWLLQQRRGNTSTPENIWLEGECAESRGSFWNVADHGGASGKKVLRAAVAYNGAPERNVSVNDSRRQATFSFNVGRAGTYYFFARTTQPFVEDGSTFIYRIDNGPWVVWRTGQSGSLDWVKIPNTPSSLTAGRHTLTFVNHRKVSLLDKILISSSNIRPTGIGADANNCSGSANARIAKVEDQKTNATLLIDENIEVYPNPADHKVNVRFTEKALSTGRLSLTDLSGKIIRQWAIPLTGEEHELHIDTHSIPTGLYLLQGGQAPIKIIVEH